MPCVCGSEWKRSAGAILAELGACRSVRVPRTPRWRLMQGFKMMQIDYTRK